MQIELLVALRPTPMQADYRRTFKLNTRSAKKAKDGRIMKKRMVHYFKKFTKIPEHITRNELKKFDIAAQFLDSLSSTMSDDGTIFSAIGHESITSGVVRQYYEKMRYYAAYIGRTDPGSELDKHLDKLNLFWHTVVTNQDGYNYEGTNGFATIFRDYDIKHGVIVYAEDSTPLDSYGCAHDFWPVKVCE